MKTAFSVVVLALMIMTVTSRRLSYRRTLEGQLTCHALHSPEGGGGEGEGSLKKVLYGEAPPRGQNPYPFIHHLR